MDIDDIKKLLKEDLEYKKVFNNSMYAFPCHTCKQTIEPSDEFIFMGDKRKVCNNCHGEILEFLESL